MKKMYSDMLKREKMAHKLGEKPQNTLLSNTDVVVMTEIQRCSQAENH